MIQAVLFDMDGVIVDTEPLHHKAYYQMFAYFNLNVTEAIYQTFTGQSTYAICKHLCTLYNLKETPETLVAKKREYFKLLFFNDSNLQLIDGVLACIQDYYANGLTLILASSASMPTINTVFNKFNLNQYFKAKISGADLVASKPNPKIFIEAARLSGFSKEECMVIEDSTNGIRAAYDANIYCVAYKSLHSKNQDYTLASKVISSFSEISFATLTRWFA